MTTTAEPQIPLAVDEAEELLSLLRRKAEEKQAAGQAAQQDAQEDILPVADSQTYQQTAVFGTYWQAANDPARKQRVDRALASLGSFYAQEIERRRWYGFWDYGDVMHTYDPVRHCWRYDVCITSP